MIARPNRFHGINSLRHVYARGQTVRASLLSVRYLANDRRSAYRAAVVVSRKVHKSAVVRNRIRRRIYEIIRRHAAEITRPYDIVVTVFSEQVAEMDANSLEAMVLGQLEKAEIIREPASAAKGPHAIVEPKEKP
ncbi:MAG: putative Ribonuclease [Candidatus Saccharibacteria bacterium]|nr:putative Ribonuclease [Candidatus Saccharibacteria bacterium]